MISRPTLRLFQAKENSVWVRAVAWAESCVVQEILCCRVKLTVPPYLFFALMPGVFLFVALRLALTGAEWLWIALSVAASCPFHITDLVRRLSA